MRVVKARYPDIKIVCGGPHVTPFPRETLMKTGCDVCVIGEGEVTFLELIDRVRDIPGNIHDIKGIAYLDEGQYVQTETRRVIDDLDTVPIPDRDLVDQRDFVGLQYSARTSQYRDGHHAGLPNQVRLLRQPCVSLAKRTDVPVPVAAEHRD